MSEPEGTETWAGRVQFVPDTAVAVTPSTVVVRGDSAAIERALQIVQGDADHTDTEDVADGDSEAEWPRHRLTGDFDAVATVARLRDAGLDADPDHVLFAHSWSGDEGGFGASSFWGNPFSGNPFSGNPFSGNPFSGNPFSGNPFSGNPFSGNPFSGNPFSGNPFSGNPFSGNPFSGNPFARVYGHPMLAGREDNEFTLTGRGRSLALPAGEPKRPTAPQVGGTPVVAVLDVPIASGLTVPDLVGGVVRDPVEPKTRTGAGGPFVAGRADQDEDEWLDRVAGHGMFVAGRIAQVAPDCELRLIQTMTNVGDAPEWHVAELITGLAGEVDILNLSFGGYSVEHMPKLVRAIRKFQTTPGPASRDGAHADQPPYRHGGVVVTSAGNDGIFVPPFPASVPGVVSVAALGPDGPAPFSNWGPWVTACATGVDVVSTFFQDVTVRSGAAGEKLRFEGGAKWSGTSFAAPLVAGKLARVVAEQKVLPKVAVHRLLGGRHLARLPYMGTIVTE